MKQILQNLKDGRTRIVDVPAPGVSRNTLLVRTSTTLVSAGTERMLVEFGKAGWIDKARQQPDKVRMVLDKIRTDGLVPTIEAVLNKLDQPLPLGYCNTGVVAAVGAGVTGFATGDRVACNGKHAEWVSVPANLCARVPDAVPDESAAFTVLGAIALQGIRLVAPTLGEAVVVVGLGLIGQMTVQLLRAQGCRVLGIDFDPAKLALARQAGAEVVDLSIGVDPVAAAMVFSRGRGMDAVLITASTSSSEPVHQAAQMSRKRGRIVLVGVTGLELSRADFFEKELSFQVSCSYGPGRYDSSYEEGGHDYPFGFVRWTEQRNFEAVLDLMASGAIDIAPLVSHRFALADAAQAYELVAGSAPSLGILLRYPESGARLSDSLQRVSRTVVLPTATAAPRQGGVRVGFIGAGNYAGAVLVPAFRRAGAHMQSIASASGVTAAQVGRKQGFAEVTTDAASVLASPQVDAVVVATRHDSHAKWAVDAIRAGKHVFVEKPLALDHAGLQSIVAARDERAASGLQVPQVMVGFNRRYSPFVTRMLQLLAAVSGPKSCVITVNAGNIPASHWTQDPGIGGGRIVGEACHFIDLARCLVGQSITGWKGTAVPSPSRVPADCASVTLDFADGSMATIHYLSSGHRGFPKERVEVFAGGRVLQLDNFRRLRAWGWSGFSGMRRWSQDKGQQDCAAAFLSAAAGGPPAMSWEELLEVTRVTLEVADGLR